MAIVIVKYRALNDAELIGVDKGEKSVKLVDSNTAFQEVLNVVGLKNLVETKSKDFNWKTVEFI